jgi:hypothetical protein
MRIQTLFEGVKMAYTHHYPLNCPECRIDLTQNQHVKVLAANLVWFTHLANNGNLVDVGGEIARGNHQSSECAVCGCNLNNHELERSTCPARRL